jgi:hypothetical protein
MGVNRIKNIDEIVNQGNKTVKINDVVQTTDLQSTTDGTNALGWDGSSFTLVSAGATGSGSGGVSTVIGSSVTYSKVGNVEYFDFAEPQQIPSKINSATDLQLIGTGVQKMLLVDGTEIDVLVENRSINGITKNWMLVAGFGNGTNYEKSLTQTLITDLTSLGSAGFSSAEMASFVTAADLVGDGVASCTFYGNPSNSHASAYLQGPAWNSNWPTWFSALGIVFTVNLSDAVGVTAKLQPSIGTHTKTVGSDQYHIWNELAAENLTINNTTGNLFYLIEDGRSNAGIAHTWVA